MADGQGGEIFAQNHAAELRILAHRAAALRQIAMRANVLPLTIAAGACSRARDEVNMVVTAIDLALGAGPADAGQRAQFATDLQRIAAMLDTALYMGGFNPPHGHSVVEWRTVLHAIMAL